MRREVTRDKSNILKLISEKAELEEGGEAVRKVLREVFRSQKVSTKKLARLTQLPVPVIAAVRRELENEGLLTRKGGAFLTRKGEEFVKEQLGLLFPQELTCQTCQGRSIKVPDEFRPILKELRKHLSTRPKPLSWLDQAYGTPETSLLRALYMLEKGDVEGRRIIFLGDDDFTSIAVGLLGFAEEITVVDFDPRLLKAIKVISEQENLHIACVECDLRKFFPRNLQRRYDVVFTDPPYTTAGLTLFVSRGILALQQRKGAGVYLAFAHQSPKKMLIVQKILNAMGLAIVEQIPRFNIYEGAEMFANTTFLARLETTERTKPLVEGTFDSKLYTGEVTPTVRIYQCRCGEQVNVGTTASVRTIEELKAEGCPKCRKTRGFKLIKKQKMKEALDKRFTLRDFEWTDFSTILELEREVARKSFPELPILDEDYHRHKLEKAMKTESNNLKVALLDNEIIGWLWLKTEKDRNTMEKFGYVKTIIVKPKHRHLGFGRKLMEEAKRYLLSKRIFRIDLIVSATNYNAALFFEEIGFKREHSTMRIRLKDYEK